MKRMRHKEKVSPLRILTDREVMLVQHTKFTATIVDEGLETRHELSRNPATKRWTVWCPHSLTHISSNHLKTLFERWMKFKHPPKPLELFRHEPWGIKFVSRRLWPYDGARIIEMQIPGYVPQTVQRDSHDKSFYVSFRRRYRTAQTLRELRDLISGLLDGINAGRRPDLMARPVPTAHFPTRATPNRVPRENYEENHSLIYLPGTARSTYLPSEVFYGMALTERTPKHIIK